MALEQWEINLRKLLEEKTAKPTVVSNIDWEKSLEKTIQDAPPVARSSILDNILIIAAFILLGAIIIFALDNNSGIKLQGLVQSKLNFFSAKGEKLEDRLQRLEDETHEQFTNLLKKYDTTVTRLDGVIAKTNLIGFLLNENFMIVRDNKDKSQLIFFKRDWKLDHAPQYIKISDEDSQYLQKYISDENR